jgi:hypothetical protein
MVKQGMAPYYRRGRFTFTAVFKRSDGLGTERVATLLLFLRQEGRLLADHVWAIDQPGLYLPGFPKGSCLSFTAEVGKYQKFAGPTDYRLMNIREVRHEGFPDPADQSVQSALARTRRGAATGVGDDRQSALHHNEGGT